MKYEEEEEEEEEDDDVVVIGADKEVEEDMGGPEVDEMVVLLAVIGAVEVSLLEELMEEELEGDELAERGGETFEGVSSCKWCEKWL